MFRDDPTSYVLREYNLDNADHDIPFLWGVDALHGNTLLAGSTAFPQRINMGATWNVDLIGETARHTSDASVTDDRPAIGYDLEGDGSKTAYAEVVEILQGLGR